MNEAGQEPIEVPVPEDELDFDEDSPNLVTRFEKSDKGKEALKKVSREVREHFDACREADEEYRQMKAEEWKIFSGELPPKQPPFENSANAHVPIALENITRLSFRASSELFGDWSAVVGVLPTGPDDVQVAEVLSKHDNWQIREQIVDFRRQQYRGILMFFLNGDVSAHSFYDPHRKSNRHETLTSDELVVPYVHVSTMPDYSDVPYLIRILRRSRAEMEAYRDIWEHVDDILNRVPPSWEEEEVETKLADGEAEIQGLQKPSDKSAPYTILHYEGWIHLPGQDRSRFMQAIVDYGQGHVLHLHVAEEEDPFEKARAQRQLEEFQQYQQAQQQYDQRLEEVEIRRMEEVGDPNITEEERQAREASFEQVQPPPPPEPPEWMNTENPEIPTPRMVPIRSFSHGVCIEPLTGNRGLGFGRIESDLNRAANVALSQFVDAATLANAKGHIRSESLQWVGGKFQWHPGAENVYKGIGAGDLQNHFQQLDYGPANPQLMELVQFCVQWGQSSIQAPDVLSGAPGKSGETFRGIATRVEQATKQLSESTRRYADFLSLVMKNNARLNSIFLPDYQLVSINDHMGGVEELGVSRAMYNRDYRVSFVSDLKFTPEAQKVGDADAALQMAASIPQLAMNPAYMYQVVKKVLVARGMEDLLPYLGAAPPPPQMPFGMAPQAPPGPQGVPGQPPGQPAPEEAA